MTSRVIVSFVGEADLEAFGLADARRARAEGARQGPILRLLDHLPGLGLCNPANTRVLLFDDRPGIDVRKRFCRKLEEALPGLGLSGLPVARVPVTLPGGPTDLQSLYDTVWSVLAEAAKPGPEVIFHLSSGTPAMQVTLLLAANSLPLKRARLFESSIQRGVQEVALPYLVATRENRRDRTRGRLTLGDKARRTLLPDTTVDDPLVEGAYASLYAAARQRGDQATVLVIGPSGSGKWHATRQFARWRTNSSHQPHQWVTPGVLPGADEIPDRDTVLVRRLDCWPTDELRRLSAWRTRRPLVAVAATLRNDVAPVAPFPGPAREGLPDAAQVLLPSLVTRADLIALAEALARQLGILDGKIMKRLQYDLLVDQNLRSLHDLKAALAGAAHRSRGVHPDRTGWIEARQIADAIEAQALLQECWAMLSGLHFGEARPDLEEVLAIVRSLVVRCAKAGGRTQKEIAALLGYEHQQRVSEILEQRINLTDWRTRLTSGDTNAA